MSSLLEYLQSTEPQFRKARLAALYSDFRHLQTLNPDGYNANITAWQRGLHSALLSGHIPSSTSAPPNLLSLSISPSLLRALDTKDWGRPLALGSVVREAVAKQEWIPEMQFQTCEGVYAKAKGWWISPWGIVGWGAGREFEKRVEGVRSRADRVFPRSEMRGRFGDLLGEGRMLSEHDFGVLLKFLQRDRGVLVYDEETVKICHGEREEITEEDTTIVSLKTLIKDLEIQTQVLTKRVEELEITAKEAVTRKNRVAALAALRSKKLAETTLTKRHATLAQLEEVFTKIEQAADQVELIRVMEASTQALSSLNKAVGGVERVDDVVDQLREQMSQVDEVGNVIAEVGQGATAVDESEVDDELEAMERQEREKMEAKERREREAREEKEAAETKVRLDALKEVEQAAKEAASKSQEADTEMDQETEEDLEDSIERIKVMAL
ncbi:hypothetical protein HYFRA_00004941 [Hymenoscyphus fraxineus]|uniref:Snf7-domain-containing protein n=1 Tax=Hymenoscyphus fraxineus TaxID=746836 RepID=A0A9N9KKG4_9HELO|nr:hypothetical protein HYFRA_00004941 [Hymenoscyphus fraxineus]